MSIQNSVKILENGKARYAECSDILQYLAAKPE